MTLDAMDDDFAASRKAFEDFRREFECPDETEETISTHGDVDVSALERDAIHYQVEIEHLQDCLQKQHALSDGYLQDIAAFNDALLTHQELYREAQADWERKIAALEETEDANNAHAEDISTLKRQHEDDIAALKSDMAALVAAQEHRDHIVELENTNQAHEALIATLQAELETMMVHDAPYGRDARSLGTGAGAPREAQDRWKEEVAALQEALEVETKQHVAQHEGFIEEIMALKEALEVETKRYEALLATQKQRYTDETTSLKESLTAAMDECDVQHRQHKRSAEYDSEIAALKETLEGTTQAHQSVLTDYATNIATLRAERVKANEHASQLHAELHSARLQADLQIQALQGQLNFTLNRAPVVVGPEFAPAVNSGEKLTDSIQKTPGSRRKAFDEDRVAFEQFRTEWENTRNEDDVGSDDANMDRAQMQQRDDALVRRTSEMLKLREELTEIKIERDAMKENRQAPHHAIGDYDGDEQKQREVELLRTELHSLKAHEENVREQFDILSRNAARGAEKALEDTRVESARVQAALEDDLHRVQRELSAKVTKMQNIHAEYAGVEHDLTELRTEVTERDRHVTALDKKLKDCTVTMMAKDRMLENTLAEIQREATRSASLRQMVDSSIARELRHDDARSVIADQKQEMLRLHDEVRRSNIVSQRVHSAEKQCLIETRTAETLRLECEDLRKHLDALETSDKWHVKKSKEHGATETALQVAQAENASLRRNVQRSTVQCDLLDNMLAFFLTGFFYVQNTKKNTFPIFFCFCGCFCCVFVYKVHNEGNSYYA
eukprot:GEMP01011721.1.p1 GENE.GEMP01011721.1~~GEMP01011721.1.p1  ORF type:complete len:790 (+),score=260.15 GEMP01011721.1:148-2517(+)